VTALIFRTTASLRWLPSLAAIVPNGTVQQRARARRPHLPQRLGGNATREWHFKDRHIPGECDPTKVLTILAVLQRRFVVGGVALGLMSSLKMLPLVGVLAFLILPIGWAQKARAVAASLLAFSAIQLVNIMISGSYGASFLKQLLGPDPKSGFTLHAAERGSSTSSAHRASMALPQSHAADVRAQPGNGNRGCNYWQFYAQQLADLSRSPEVRARALVIRIDLWLRGSGKCRHRQLVIHPAPCGLVGRRHCRSGHERRVELCCYIDPNLA
jgi:hypothetical protein